MTSLIREYINNFTQKKIISLVKKTILLSGFAMCSWYAGNYIKETYCNKDTTNTHSIRKENNYGSCYIIEDHFEAYNKSLQNDLEIMINISYDNARLTIKKSRCHLEDGKCYNRIYSGKIPKTDENYDNQEILKNNNK